MATANSTRRLAGSSLSAHPDEFAALSRRLLVAINQVMLVSQHFGDLSGFGQEDAPAGLTLYAAAQDLDHLYNELDAWYVRHEHSSKSTGHPFGVFKDDGAERTPLAGLPSAIHCPFCGRPDDVMVSQIQADDHAQGPWFRAHCGICGVDAPGGETPLAAARCWNSRPAPAGSSPAGSEAATDSAAPVDPLPPVGASDQTADRIRAFLASVRPLSGLAMEDSQQYQCGRVVIERMAMTAGGTDDPSIVLLPTHCADVLNFLSHVEPLEPHKWWKDPDDSPSHLVGYEFVLRTLESNLRKVARS